MTTDEILQYLSYIIGASGLIIAIIQGFERKKLKQFMHSQAWHIFQLSNLSYGSTQSALKLYKETYHDKINPEIFEQLSKCEAYNINLFFEIIRQIKLSEPKFNMLTIKAWQVQGRISEQHASFFIKQMSFEIPGIFLQALNTLTMKISNYLAKMNTPCPEKNNGKNNT